MSNSIKKPNSNNSLFGNFNNHLRLGKQDSKTTAVNYNGGDTKQVSDINENITNESSHECLDLVKKINMDPVKRGMVKGAGKKDNFRGFNDKDILNKYISTHVM